MIATVIVRTTALRFIRMKRRRVQIIPYDVANYPFNTFCDLITLSTFLSVRCDTAGPH